MPAVRRKGRRSTSADSRQRLESAPAWPEAVGAPVSAGVRDGRGPRGVIVVHGATRGVIGAETSGQR